MCVRVLRWNSAVTVQCVLRTCVRVASVQHLRVTELVRLIIVLFKTLISPVFPPYLQKRSRILDTLMPPIVWALQAKGRATHDHTRVTALGVVAHYADLLDDSSGECSSSSQPCNTPLPLTFFLSLSHTHSTWA